jgi:predicted small lipoprotein YifL
MRLAPVAALVLCIAACGQKGSLYLRDNPPSGVKPAQAETYKPVPYPKESADDAGTKQ